MGNDIEITVRVSNQTQAGVTAATQSLRGLRDAARDAGQSIQTLGQRAVTAAVALQGLAGRADAAARSLRDLRARAAAAGDSFADLSQQNTLANSQLRTFVTRLGSADTRLGDLDDRVRTLRGSMDDFGAATRDANGDLGDLRGNLGTLRVAAEGASNALGSSGGASGGGGLLGVLIGVGAAIGASMLPALGALVPLMAAGGVATGTLALGFNGIGEALEQAGKDQEKYKDALKKLGPEQREFTKALVEAKKQFAPIGKEVQKAMLPAFTKVVKEAGPAVDILGDAMVDMASGFGDAADALGRLMKDSGFQTDFRRVLDLGNDALREIGSGMDDFVLSLLDFGAKSEPTLKALSSGISDLFGEGLPGMFDGLETGIGGTSEMLDGFFSMINSILPAIGRFSGQLADTFGPTFKELFDWSGDGIARGLDILTGAMKTAKPFVDDLTAGFKLFREQVDLVVDIASDLGGAILGTFLPSMGKVDEARGPFERLYDTLRQNKGLILEGGRLFSQGVLTMVEVAIRYAPTIIDAFRIVSTGVLTAIDGMVSGLAAAFGDLPIVGDQFKKWNTDFDLFRSGFLDGLEDASGAAKGFADEALPRLEGQRLKLDISNFDAQIKAAKEELKDPDLTRERKAVLDARIDQLQAKKRAAVAELGGFGSMSASAKLNGDKSGFDRALGAVRGAAMPTKTARVTANTGGFWGAISAIRGRVLGTAYINVESRSTGRMLGGATGGLYTGSAFRTGYAEGGPVRGPGTGTSDDVFAPWLSNGEFVMKAAAVQKYGERFMQLINEGRLEMPRFAKGGSVSKKERHARSDAWSDLTISHFGRMAGYQRSEFGNALGRADGVGQLVSALNQWRSIIMKSTHGGQERSLLKQLDSTARSLIKYEKAQAKLTAELDKAKSKLSDLKNAAAQLKDSVKSGILGSANITRGASGDGRVTTASIMSGLVGSRDKATSFAQALKDLQAKGLSGDLLRQIAEAGIEGGGLETATALLGASGSEIKSMNQLQAEINKAAGSAGKTTADAVYGAAIKAQEKLVKELKAEQKKLTDAMAKLTKTMEKAIEQAFKGKASGGIIGAASGGVRGGMTWVGEQGPELVRLPVGSRVYPAGASRQMGYAPGFGIGGGQPMVIHQTITLDGAVVARQIFDPLRKEIRARGTSLGGS